MKRTSLSLILSAALAACSLQALALDYPIKSTYDHRVRFATFNPNDVVQLDTVISITTHIELEKGENYLTHVFGDSAAYSFAQVQNHIFIKPIGEQADTNLIVVTDRRTYKFRLIFKPTREGSAVYNLTFQYPDTQERLAREALERARVEDGFKDKGVPVNLQYAMAGDLDIAPINAWDRNGFTYFKFPGNVDLPGIYMVDAEGNESIVNRTSEGDSQDLYVVHKVNAKWMLRLGERALAVYNEAYDPVGVANTSRTASPSVKRVVKGAE